MRNDSDSALLSVPVSWNQGVIYCTCGHLLVESDSSQNFVNGDWILSQFRTTPSERSDLVVFDTANRGSETAPNRFQRVEEMPEKS